VKAGANSLILLLQRLQNQTPKLQIKEQFLPKKNWLQNNLRKGDFKK
jgi:hypothetical protein